MKTLFKFTRKATDEDKLSPQAKVIVEAGIAAGGVGKTVERAALVKTLEDSKALNTRQDVGRVIAFYQPRLKEAGILEVIKEKAPEKEKAEAKAKPAKAEAKPAKAA